MKNMIRLLAVLMLLVSLPFVVSSAESAAPVRVAGLKGPTGMALAHIMAHNENGAYAFALETDPTVVRDMVIAGQTDIAAVPINMGAALYNKTQGGVKGLALITRGMLYVLEKGDSVHSVQDLAGKTITAAGQGATPEYVANYILQTNGVSATLDFKTEHAEVTTLAAQGLTDLVLLPEPQVTSLLMQAPDFHKVLDITEEFAAAAKLNGEEDAQLSMSIVVARTEFVENHPEALAQFLADLEASITFANENVAEAAQEIAAQGIIPKAAVAEKALPSCALVYVDGADMAAQATPLYQILFNANPAAVGGKVPDEGFFLK